MSTLGPNARAALIACTAAGRLVRGRGGYGVTREVAYRFNQRTIYALARADLIEFTDGESAVRPTAEGIRVATELRAQQPTRSAA